MHIQTKAGQVSAGGFSRREFLHAAAVGAAAAGLSPSQAALAESSPSQSEKSCILLFLVGGPSHIDTWDPKPAAPGNVRGPFKPAATTVAGLQLCEHFPLMAQAARRFSIVRSLHHNEAPIHETGHQLMQTGALSRENYDPPHYGSVLSYLRGPKAAGVPPFVILPGPLGNTGVTVSHGQSAGFLGAEYEPFVSSPGNHTESLTSAGLSVFDESASLRERYGRHQFGRACLQARQSIESGARFVTVNMFDTVFNKTTWDCHADGGALGTTLDDYKNTICPMFDRAYTALLEDLHQRGLLNSTLVVAMGEFGRTPRLNPLGGRDHWPGVWSILMAGGGVQGGRIIGASDRIGSEPQQRPVTPAEVAATIYRSLGVDPSQLIPTADRRLVPIVSAAPIGELF